MSNGMLDKPIPFKAWFPFLRTFNSACLNQSSAISGYYNIHPWLKHIDRPSLISLPFLNTVKLMPGSNKTTHIRILCGEPCNFFNHFLLIDWFSLVCGPQIFVIFYCKNLLFPVCLSFLMFIFETPCILFYFWI